MLFPRLICLFFLAGAASCFAELQRIDLPRLSAAPKLDGDLSEWQMGLRGIPLHKPHERVSVDLDVIELAGGYDDEFIYFALRWSDSTLDAQHKPYVWDETKQRYVTAEQREDRVAIQFEMSGQYDANWLSGSEFEADMWHWKSSRSAPLGLAHDKMTIISRSRLSRAFRAVSPEGFDVYIQRPSDAGDKLYSSKRYGLKQSMRMPKYVLNYKASGSVADVAAASRWGEGRWNLELRRRLDTGKKDDVVFTAGDQVRGGIAVFNRTGDDNHVISNTLSFRLSK